DSSRQIERCPCTKRMFGASRAFASTTGRGNASRRWCVRVEPLSVCGGGGIMPEVKPNKPIPIDPNRNIGRPPKPETVRRYYQNNPDVWLEKVFGITLWEKQREILRDVWNNRYVAVKSCFASGKSFLGACLVMAFSHLWPYSVVLTTARTFRQVRANIWQMVHWLKERARIPLGSDFLQTEIRLAPGWYALGFSTDDPGTIQGIHPKSGKILIIVDESA